MSKIMNCTYTKDSGEVSNRSLFVTTPAPKNLNLFALDLTGMEPDQQAKVVDLYKEWKDIVEKPYKELLKAFEKEHKVSFDKWLKEKHEMEAQIKSFHAHGIKEITE